jgi:hypothetical protein
MLVRFTRSGGFGGMRISGVVDTETLSPAEAEKLIEIVKTADFFSLPEKFPRPSKGADYFTYIVTVEEMGRTHTVEVSEPAAPQSLVLLIRYLTAAVKK